MKISGTIMILSLILYLVSSVILTVFSDYPIVLIEICQGALFASAFSIFLFSHMEGFERGRKTHIGKVISLDDLAKTDTGREFQVLSLHPAKTDADMLGVVRRMTDGEVRLVRGLFSGIEEGNLVILRADEGNGTGAAFVRVKDGLPPTEQQVADLSQMINETTGRSGQK